MENVTLEASDLTNIDVLSVAQAAVYFSRAHLTMVFFLDFNTVYGSLTVNSADLLAQQSPPMTR